MNLDQLQKGFVNKSRPDEGGGVEIYIDYDETRQLMAWAATEIRRLEVQVAILEQHRDVLLNSLLLNMMEKHQP